MFKVKAKTNSVKLKDINKYIGRVWVLLKDAEVKKSKDLLDNKHKLIIQTDNEQFKEMFNVKSTVTKSTVQNIEVVQDKNMFVAQPNEKPVDKVEEVFVAEQPTLDFEIPTVDLEEQMTILPYTFDVDKRADELLEELNEAQQETNTIEEQFTPCDIDETNATISTQETTVEDVQVEEPFVPQIDEGITEIDEGITEIDENITETNEIKTEESFIYNTKTDDHSKKRRGRPKKSDMD